MKTNGTLKYKSKHKILFDGRIALDVTVVSMAMMGMTTKAIAKATGLTPSQVSYRIIKAQKAEGVDDGYRGAWRSGSSPYCQQVKRIMLPKFSAHVRTTLPKMFITPPVEASPVRT